MGNVGNSKLWHDEFRTWQQRNTFLFNNEFMSDCSFIISEGDNKIKIPAHKYILGGFSVEFFNFFYLMEAESSEIPIFECSVSVLKVFLKYVYTGETNLTMLNISDVLRLMKRFSAKCFKDYCEEFLIKKLNKKNYIELMDISHSYGMRKLFSKCKSLQSSTNSQFWRYFIFIFFIIVFLPTVFNICEHLYLTLINFSAPKPKPESNLFNCIYNLVN